MPDDSNIRSGQCQCGQIQYRISGDPLTYYACHCLDCQKQSSAAFGLSLWIRPADFDLSAGELSFWTTYGDSGKAKICGFCNQCGSRIYHASEDPSDPISLKAGSLHDSSELQPIAHIWTKSALPWIKLDRQRYQCYDTEPDDDAELERLWKHRHTAS